MILFRHKLPEKQKRCDARCYNALPGSLCHCICSGHNHAQGLEKAITITRRYVGSWETQLLDEYGGEFWIAPTVRYVQMELFKENTHENTITSNT